jgi:alkylation response protein AidB-like acyl-CoA dehydrogenase
MANFFKDNEDLQYYFREGIDWEPLVRLTEFDYRAKDAFTKTDEAVEFYREIAEMVGEFTANEIAPHAAKIDREGVQLVDGEAKQAPEMDAIFRKISELELHGMTLPRELGGMNCPLLLYFLNSEMMGRADVSVLAHHSFHGGMAMAMLIFSIREGTTEIDTEKARIVKTRWADYIEEIRTGKAWGCMDITEPHAGSDMAQLRTVGEQDEDGNWFVSGEKIFITAGHGKYHFVIARTEPQGDPDDPFAGLGGLSMFLVPTYRENADGTRERIVQITRVEEKLGHHGSTTAALLFDRAPADLIGERGEGFKHMLTLMNNARVGVGFECIGICEAAYRAAKAYAEERPSMGKTIDRHEMIADYLDEMRTDIQGIRALTIWAAYHEEVAQKLLLGARFGGSREGGMSVEEMEREAKRRQRLSRRATPLLKYLASEKAVQMARRCVQIHGGNGYMNEYPAEKILRDALVMPIYEGTSQIQSLMAMKDTLGGIMKNPQRFLRRAAQSRWRSVSARDPLERRVAKLNVLCDGVKQHLMRKTAEDKLRSVADQPMTAWPEKFLKNWDPKRDFAFAMLHAERLTKILADEMVCEVLLEQAQRHPHRRDVLERYLERAEPRCRYWAEEITTTGSRLLERLARREDEGRAHAAE